MRHVTRGTRASSYPKDLLPVEPVGVLTHDSPYLWQPLYLREAQKEHICY